MNNNFLDSLLTNTNPVEPPETIERDVPLIETELTETDLKSEELLIKDYKQSKKGMRSAIEASRTLINLILTDLRTEPCTPQTIKATGLLIEQLIVASRGIIEIDKILCDIQSRAKTDTQNAELVETVKAVIRGSLSDILRDHKNKELPSVNPTEEKEITI